MAISVTPDWLPKDACRSFVHSLEEVIIPPCPILSVSDHADAKLVELEREILKFVHTDPDAIANTSIPAPFIFDISTLLAVEMASYDVTEAELMDRFSASAVVRNERALERAVVLSVASGRFYNAYELVRRALLQYEAVIDSEMVRVRLLSILQKVESDRWPESFRPAVEQVIASLSFIGPRVSNTADETLPQEDRKVVEWNAYHEFREGILVAYPNLKRALPRAIAETQYLAMQEVYDEIVTLAEDRLPQLITFARPLLEQDPKRVAALLRVWGPEGWGIASRSDFVTGELNETDLHTFRRIHYNLANGMCDDDFGGLAARLRLEHIRNFRKHIDAIIHSAGKYQLAAFSQLHTCILETFDPTTLSNIVYLSRGEAELSNIALTKIVNQYRGESERIRRMVERLIDVVGWNLPKILTFAPLDCFSKENESTFIQFAIQRPDVAWALCKQFGTQALELSTQQEFHCKISAIRKLFAHRAPDYIAYSDPQEWDQSHFSFHREVFGQAAGQTLMYGRLWRELTLDPWQVEFLRQSTHEFNLKSFHRYTATSRFRIDFSLLHQNFDNLDPGRARERPLALVVFAEDDHNNAFESAYRILKKLSKTYKVVFVEASSTSEFVRFIERFGDRQFAPNGISLLYIAAHGTKEGVLWSRRTTPKGADERLDIDAVRNLQHLDYFNPNSTFILGTCEAAFPLEGGSSFLNEAHKSIPASTAVGSQRFAGIEDFIYEDNGMVSGAIFTCAPRKVKQFVRQS